ncbi:predicted DNA binding protein [Streptomyces venezuelae ATCC 10712]|uniref:Predicted DNA binding protein n=2 Tax=Streptomyces TaxID=1883 RepID=F2RFW0_STRVP|nr:predicted DNA binding protein [Streptomyces venezuelae ATCC 10712]
MNEMVAHTGRYARVMSLHRVGSMADQQHGRRAIEMGPTGEAVAHNLARLRKLRGLSTRQLAALLEQRGRSISPSGIIRMEKAERHVTADELVALAAALGVSPASLYLPQHDGPRQTIPITGVGDVPADTAWEWASNKRPLVLPEGSQKRAMTEYRLYALPPHMAGLVEEAMPLQGWVTRDGVQYNSATGEPREATDG